MEKRYCKKCGRPLDRGDVDYCRGCIEEENEESYLEYKNQGNDQKENSYTNTVASDFKVWSRNVNAIGIFIAIILLVFSISNSMNETTFVIAFFVYCSFKATSLLLLAIAEIIQKLQNIEDKINRN